jgi:alpha-beta hydrolase superfamily lysophospholipase
VTSIELTVDVTEAAGLGTPAEQAVTVHLPDAGVMADPPVVCFAFPGAGYSRGYYSFDMPGSAGGGEAGWHAARGWVFVTVDHLGVGKSTVPVGNVLEYDNVTRANQVVVETVMARLEAGTVTDDLAPLVDATVLGFGQSMGGCFTIVAQGRHRVFDGVAILGFSAIHTVVPAAPGSPPVMESADPRAAMEWAFHWDDEPAEVVAADMNPTPGSELPIWRSASVPGCAILMVNPGTVSAEAAAIDVPVMIAVGERDVALDPWAEPQAFAASSDVSVFVCPQMAHMHNFAATRARFWARLHHWGTGVAAANTMTP